MERGVHIDSKRGRFDETEPVAASALGDDGEIGSDSTAGDRAFTIAAIVALAVVGLVSFFLLAGIFSSPDSYAHTIASLDQKKTTVMELVGASTAASAAITLLPGDAGTPIAEKLVDLSSDFVVVLCAIYLEKYLLTVLGLAAFRVLIPLGCLLAIIALIVGERYERLQGVLWKLAAKLAVFGVVAFLVVPASVLVSNMIESTYQESIDETISAAQQSTVALEGSTQEGESTDSQAESGSDANEEDGPFPNFIEPVANAVEDFTEDTRQTLVNLQSTLNKFIEALALMIVTSCVIPILVLLFFLWIAKLLLGIDISVPARALRPRSLRGRR